jgi:hypothetical protein
MLEELRKAAIEQAMKVMSHPAVGKLLSDQRLLGAISKGLEIHGQIKKALEEKLRGLARQMQLASYEELERLNQNVEQLRAKIADLEKKLRSPARRPGGNKG